MMNQIVRKCPKNNNQDKNSLATADTEASTSSKNMSMRSKEMRKKNNVKELRSNENRKRRNKNRVMFDILISDDNSEVSDLDDDDYTASQQKVDLRDKQYKCYN